MKPPPRWRPAHGPAGAYRGPIVSCPRCGYASWRGACCAYCGGPLQPPIPGGPDGPASQHRIASSPARTEPAWSYPRLFVVWFLVGLLLGLVTFLPRARAMKAEAWTEPAQGAVTPPVSTR